MEKKVAVITGASGGIGAALAKKLGSEGYSLVLAARRKKELEAAASHHLACPVTAVYLDIGGQGRIYAGLHNWQQHFGFEHSALRNR